MTKGEILAEMRNAFCRRYRDGGDHHLPHEFEIELDRLIYAAFEVAQEPFQLELDMRRKTATEIAMLSPTFRVPDAPAGTS